MESRIRSRSAIFLRSSRSKIHFQPSLNPRSNLISISMRSVCPRFSLLVFFFFFFFSSSSAENDNNDGGWRNEVNEDGVMLRD